MFINPAIWNEEERNHIDAMASAIVTTRDFCGNEREECDEYLAENAGMSTRSYRGEQMYFVAQESAQEHWEACHS